MRYLSCVLMLAALPVAAAAQHSSSLPSIGLPLPAIGLRAPPWEQPRVAPWERPQIPEWERNRIPPWEKGYVPKQPDGGEHRRDIRGPQVIYYVPYAVPVPQSPQVIVVQQPPVTHVVRVEVPAPAPREEPPAVAREPAPPPFVPSGDRRVYVIPGCYVGNVPPQDVKLPAHCDLRKVTTFNP